MLTCPYDDPTEVGQRVFLYGFGGEVTRLMEFGVVERFNRSGFPVVRVTDRTFENPSQHYTNGKTVTDRYGCFKVMAS